MVCSLTFFEFYSCFTYILPLLYPKHGTILFCLPLFFLSFHTYFIATPPPIRLLFALLHLNILPYINKKFLHFNFIPPHLEHGSNLFNLHSHLFFLSKPPPFPLVSLLLFLNKNSFSTHLNPFAAKAWLLYRAIAMTLPHKSSAIAT